MVKFVLASLVIFVVMVAWLYVQDLYRRFARRNPGLGPYRSDRGCGGSCSCRQGSCPTSTAGRDGRVVPLDLMTPVGDRRSLRRNTQ